MKHLWMVLLAAPLMAQSVVDEIAPRRTSDYDERRDRGRCEIRLSADNEVNVYLQGFRVIFETVRGQRARDMGTECSQPLPAGPALANFRFEGIDGRGDVRLIEDPRPQNRFRAWVKIRDSKDGADRYHFRLSWEFRPGGNYAPQGNGGAGWGDRSGPRPGGERDGDRQSGSGSGFGGMRVQALANINRGHGAFSAQGTRYRTIDEARVQVVGDGSVWVELRGEAALRIEGRLRSQTGDDTVASVERIDGNPARGEMRVYWRLGRVDRVEIDGQVNGRDYRLDFTGDR